MATLLQAPTEVQSGHHIEAAVLLRLLVPLLCCGAAGNGLLWRPTATGFGPPIRIIIVGRCRPNPTMRSRPPATSRRRRLLPIFGRHRCRRSVHRVLTDDSQIVPADDRGEDVLAGRLKDGPLPSVMARECRRRGKIGRGDALLLPPLLLLVLDDNGGEDVVLVLLVLLILLAEVAKHGLAVRQGGGIVRRRLIVVVPHQLAAGPVRTWVRVARVTLLILAALKQQRSEL